jgi:hypothetical protein
MLTRISGGHSGIKAYLENGHKQGREFSRDELDERVILAGDLEFTHQIIGGLEMDGERYLHITLAFKEDEIPNETLRAIAEDFRKFMFSAYKDDEYNFYAEAHLPKIKSYEHQTTGEVIERKPHIHIVVPKTNLRSGGALNPFGLVEWSERHIDAAQEHINNKYGLASPKDNRRLHFTDASDMIARYKEDNFGGANRDLKKAILEAIIERDITSYNEFGKLVAEFGGVKSRNAGREGEYLNVKPEGNAKGVNLKDYPFSREFIEMPGEEKKRVLSAEIQRKYEIQGEARKDPANVAAALDEWHRFRAREVKYVNSGNKKLYQVYRAAAPAEREQMLDQLAKKFYDKYRAPAVEPDRFTGRDPFDPDYGFKRPASQDPSQNRSDGPPGRDQRAAGMSVAAPGERAPGGPEYVGGGEVDRFGAHPARQQPASGMTGAESIHSINDVPRTPAGQRALPTPAIHDQEPNHEPERYVGKNPVGHRYGFKRPSGGSGRHGADERPGRIPGAESGRSGGSAAAGRRWGPAGQWSAAGPGFVGASDQQYDTLSLAGVEKTRSINRLRNVPGGLVVQPGREGAVLLPHHASGQLGNGRKRPNQGVRRPRDRRQSAVSGTGRAYDSVVSQVARDFAERQSSGDAGKLSEFQEIKQNLDARRLLAELSRSHGVLVDKYQVIEAPDRSHRIRCGTRNLNVGDFLTKEVRLPWAEAATILRHSYSRQLDRHPQTPPRFAPNRALWRQFQDQRRARGGLRSQLAAQIASERQRRDAIRQRLELARGASAGLPASARKAALSVARMEYVTASDALRSTIRAERAPFRLPVADQYRHFLQQRAQEGDAAALVELRKRSNSAPLRHDPAAGYILPVQADQEPNALLYRGRQVRYRVQHNGDVIYSLAGRAILHDKGDTVLLLQTDRLAIETALRLAQAKFGDQLKLSGSAEFQEQAARIAAEAGLNVRFDNKHAEQIREQRAAEIASQRAAGRRYLETQATTPARGGAPGSAAQEPTRSGPGQATRPQSDRDKDIER